MSAFRSFIDAVLYPFRMLSRIPGSVVSSPRRMMGLSLPVRAALLIFVCLLLIVIGWCGWWIYNSQGEQTGSFFPRELPIILILIIAIPCVVWYATKLWLQGERSPFPDIERVWKLALTAFAEQAIDPMETPIFLVLGPSNAMEVDSFMASSNTSYPLIVPTGPGPVHIYAHQQGIYIICTDCGSLADFLGRQSIAKAATGFAAPQQATPFDGTRTMQIGVASGNPLTTTTPPNPTETFGRMPEIAVPRRPGTNPQGNRGTMLIGDPGATESGVLPPQQQDATARSEPRRSDEATARLTYLLHCVRQSRDPLCPVNGILVATPFRLLVDSSQEVVNQLQKAIISDISTLRTESRIRCAVTHVINGMDEEPGFRELIRRVGNDRAAAQRFGKGFGLWNLPTSDQLEALVRHSCGAFEDWSYLLFREEDGLNKRGNRYLYALLCRIRTKLAPRLSHLIKSTYAYDRTGTTLVSQEPMLFSGCYFVAGGPTPDRQAFASSIFLKAQQEEEELEWGSEALAEENRMQTIVYVLLVLNGSLVAGIAAVLFYLFKGSS